MSDEQDRAGAPEADFEAAYAGAPPWDIGRPQPELAALELRGAVLDVGCGTGEHALHFAARGCEVLGIDAVPAAVARAQAQAAGRRLSARFEVADALHLGALGRRFDHVIDCGLFHVFGDADRRRYVDSLAAAIKPGGAVHLHCFSERTPGSGGPRRVTQPELHAAFADGWVVRSLTAATYQTIWPDPQPQAWLAWIERRPPARRLAVLGASGRVGAAAVRQALAAGHRVRAVVRRAVEVPGAEVVQLSAWTPDAIAAAVSGVDAVISAIGGTVADATRVAVAAMKTAGVGRIVAVGAAGLTPRGDGRLRGEVALPPGLQAVFAEHRAALESLQASGLAWTVICPPNIVDGAATRRYRARVEGFPEDGQTLAIGDVADALLLALHREDLHARRLGVAY